MKNHGVYLAFIKEMKKLGYDDLSTDPLVEMKIHGVNLDFVEGMQALGYDDVSVGK